MHARFIYVGSGCWGGGDTLPHAKQNYRKAGGRMRGPRFGFIFVADQPFVGLDEDTDPKQPDAYVSQFGSLCWQNCTKFELQ